MTKSRRDRDRLSRPAEAQQLPSQQHRVETRIETFVSVGPIPPPEILAQYASLDATLLDRIVKMAETEQAHRHEQERAEGKFTAAWLTLAQIIAGLLGMCSLGVAAYATLQAQPVIAVTAITSTAGILAVFVWQDRKAAKAAADEQGDSK